MNKENLFELIRRGEVIIWAGAGLSMYAGFPSGTRLGKILLENLSKQELELINPNLLLPDLAEEFYRIKGDNKNSLIQILNKIFIDFIPIETSCHDKLSRIPHFKTIITTNYDKLIENSYGTRGQIVYSSEQIPYIKNTKTQIFKVHGDLSTPSSIIITRNDYNRFFKDGNENDILWTIIKERLSTKSVLFIGYNLEDPNVSVIFDRISDSLSSHRKESFLVVPNLPQHKISNLNNKGIQYINSSAEELIDDLIKNINENIINDLQEGKISADIFRQYLIFNNLLPELKSTYDSFKLLSISGTNGNVEGKFNFSVESDENFINDFNDFISGKRIGEFEITEDKLLNTTLWFGGLKFPESDKIIKIKMESIPSKSTKFDIRFDNGFEFSDIPVKLYNSNSFFEFHFDFNNAFLKIKMDLNSSPETRFTFNYHHKEICSRVKDEIDFYSLLENIASGNNFTIFIQTGETFSKSFPEMEPLLQEAKYFLLYFNNLKQIEQYYNLRFINIPLDSITDKTYKITEMITSVITGKRICIKWDDELLIELNDNSDSLLTELGNFNPITKSIFAIYKDTVNVDIHGQGINLGYKKVEILEPYISNLDAILSRNERIVKIKSRNKKIVVSYSDRYEIE